MKVGPFLLAYIGRIFISSNANLQATLGHVREAEGLTDIGRARCTEYAYSKTRQVPNIIPTGPRDTQSKSAQHCEHVQDLTYGARVPASYINSHL